MKKVYFSILAVFFLLVNASAQCPASITVTSTNVTTATCPSNGAFTINATVGTGATYQITAGPAGFPAGAQNSPTFAALLPGTYSVKVACQASPAIFTTTSITIPTSYVQVAANSVVTNVCSANAPGGTITTTATGSSTPFTYAYWQGDPAAPDNTLTYGTANTYTAPAFGTYNIRTKDNCGVFVTQQVTVANPYPAGFCIQSIGVYNDTLTCAQLQDSIMAALWFTMPLSSLPAAGIDIDIYNNNNTCASPVQGAFVKTLHLNNTSSNTTIIKRGQSLIFVMRSACGTLCTYCYTYNPPNTISQNSQMASSGCAGPDNIIKYTIRANVNDNFKFPVTFVIKNSAGTVVGTFTANGYADLPHDFNNLPADTYTSTMTDVCGNSTTQTFTPPTGLPNQLTVTAAVSFSGCTSIEGRTSLRIDVNGPMANLVNAVAKIIPPSPNLIGVLGTYANSAGGYDFRDVIPGATYYIEIDNQCGQKDTVTVVVPIDPGQVLIKHTTATVQQLCGGTGNIVVDAAYNGWGGIEYVIKNSAGTVVATGTKPGGTYSNMPAGIYTVKTTILWCMDGDTSSFQVTVLANGSGPVVIKKLGIICEDALGVPMTTGSALISFIGAKALKVEYKLSAQPDVNYITLTTNSDGNETITGLLANTSYQVRITDVCGNSAVTEISIGQLSPLTTTANAQPCVGANYTLGVPDMIDATYTWKKDGVTISTNREINFPSYTAGDDGVYTCTIVIAGCVTRTVTVTLNSFLCGQPLPIKLIAFTVQKNGTSAKINWATEQESNSSYFNVERSADGSNWTTIATVSAAGNSSLRIDYGIFDNAPLTGINYYRLKLADKDGKYAYSSIQTALFKAKYTVEVAPNPAKNFIHVYMAKTGTQAATIQLINTEGKLIYTTKASQAHVQINTSGISKGLYFVKVVDADNVTVIRVIVE